MTSLDRRSFIAATLALAASSRALAQDFPSRPIRFIVPFGPAAAPTRRPATSAASCRS
ncbi:hypothetical protein [Xylophilus rhododendri]|uniref:hypothetical protein n=1 Tax=Xylophilus rhododendri TaxID=2697032 RepID=UPI001E46EEA4|nr:hypothetical protein [Xylophilus rhododendri]